MCSKNWKGITLWALIVALAFGAGAMALAQDKQADGRIVRIGPDDGGQPTLDLPKPAADVNREQRQTASPYWIGLLGGPVTPELRAHIELPDDQGLLVREIVPNSPAAMSGLKLYDILLRANDAQLHEMSDLVELVRTEGQKQGQIILEVLRKGQRESVTVKPEERPANVAQAPGGFGERGTFEGQPGQIPALGDMPQFRRFFEGFGREGFPMEFRQFGPGVVVGGQAGGVAAMPDGVSISIQKQNDQPARITVKRGDETWEVVGNDTESLNQLPEDLRPFVERMLHGNGPGIFDFDQDGGADLRRPRANADVPEMGGPALGQRIEAMERQIQELLEQTRGANQRAGEQSK